MKEGNVMKILSYDSKLMQTFRLLFDYIGLNLTFLLCCLPVITIGSARTAFYTAMRAMHRNEPWFTLFFQTFKTSLKQPTIIWCICLPLTCVFAMNTYNMFSLGQTAMGIVSGVCLGVTMCVASLCPMFYSQFDCTVKEMFRNSLGMLIAFPVRVILGTALSWAPVAIAVIPMLHWMLLEGLFIFSLLYFSLVGALFTRMMRYPFGRLIGDVPEKEESYFIKEAKKNIAKMNAELVDKDQQDYCQEEE